MSNKRIYELAKELNQPSKNVVEKAQQLGINVKNHMGAITTGDEKKLQQAFKKPQTNKKPAQQASQKPAKSQPQTSRMNKRNKKQKRNNKKITATIKIAVKGAVK